jgi:hypothetical protein
MSKTEKTLLKSCTNGSKTLAVLFTFGGQILMPKEYKYIKSSGTFGCRAVTLPYMFYLSAPWSKGLSCGVLY